MRPASFISLLVVIGLFGCDEVSVTKSPQTQQHPTTATTPAADPTTTPSPQVGFRPRLQAPKEPPEEDNFDYEEWLSIQDLPAISSDGALLARINAVGFVEREGKGDTIRLEFIDTSDYQLKQSVDLLLPKETYSFDAEALAMTQSALAEQVAPRVKAAQELLDKTSWLPITALAQSGKAFIQKSPASIKVSFDEKALRLLVEVNKKKVKDEKLTKWKAPKAKPCNKKDPEVGCGCEYPLALRDALYSAALKTFLLFFEYQTTRACQEPPPDPAMTFQYKAK